MSDYWFWVSALAFGAFMFLMGFLGGYFHPFARRVTPRGEAWRWIAENYPAALREMPTALFRDIAAEAVRDE